jgi:hypothetical protein
VIRILKNITFNETEIATSINIRSLPQEATTFTTSTEITEITTNANTNLNNAEKAFSENIIINLKFIRKLIRHRKIIFKIMKINIIKQTAVRANIIKEIAVKTYIMKVTKALIISINENWDNENDLPQIIIAKLIIVNKNKVTYEKAIANSEKS